MCQDHICLACFDILKSANIKTVMHETNNLISFSKVDLSHYNKINFVVTIPPILELIRSTIRVTLWKTKGYEIKYTSFENTVALILGNSAKKILKNDEIKSNNSNTNNNNTISSNTTTNNSSNTISITVNYNIATQTELWHSLFPSVTIKNLKRKHYHDNSNKDNNQHTETQGEGQCQEINRTTIENASSTLKSMNDNDLYALSQRLKAIPRQKSNIANNTTVIDNSCKNTTLIHSVRFNMKFTESLFFIFGRYIFEVLKILLLKC